MQTFLPYADFTKTASVLDRQRLGKQRLENVTILNALVGEGGYAHHPATLQWLGYEHALAEYHEAIIHEWVDVRGYKDAQWDKFMGIYEPWSQAHPERDFGTPPWLGDEAYHLSHQSKLVHKAPEFYRPLFPDVPDDLEDVWPSKEARFSE